MNIHLRRASTEDCGIIFNWINDPIVRSMSFSTAPIELNEHKTWFNKKINDSNNCYFIAEIDDNIPIGQVRFEIMDGGAEISVLVAPEYRGKGFGEEIISKGSFEMFEKSSVKIIHACVKIQNRASLKSFLKSGYIIKDKIDVNGDEVYQLILNRAIL